MTPKSELEALLSTGDEASNECCATAGMVDASYEAGETTIVVVGVV